MAKLTAWLVTLIGVLLVLALLLPATFSGEWFSWALAIIVLVIGVSKLIRNYSDDRRK